MFVMYINAYFYFFNSIIIIHLLCPTLNEMNHSSVSKFNMPTFNMPRNVHMPTFMRPEKRTLVAIAGGLSSTDATSSTSRAEVSGGGCRDCCCFGGATIHTA